MENWTSDYYSCFDSVSFVSKLDKKPVNKPTENKPTESTGGNPKPNHRSKSN